MTLLPRPPMVLNFGKHRGEPLEDLPPDYIEWVLTNVDLTERHGEFGHVLEEELQNQLQLRRGFGVVRKTGPPDPGLDALRLGELRDRLKTAKGAARTAPGGAIAPEADPDPLGWVAECPCGRCWPVAGPEEQDCPCGRTVTPR